MKLTEQDLAERIGLLMFQLWALDKELTEAKEFIRTRTGEFFSSSEENKRGVEDARHSSSKEVLSAGQGSPARS